VPEGVGDGPPGSVKVGKAGGRAECMIGALAGWAAGRSILIWLSVPSVTVRVSVIERSG
jgi:hypothetical protein